MLLDVYKRQLYITGKGRCNITNACDMEGLFDAVRTNAKFLYSSFYGYTNQQVIDFFERIEMCIRDRYIDVRIYTWPFQSPGVRKKLPVAGSADTEIQYIISEKCIFKS